MVEIFAEWIGWTAFTVGINVVTTRALSTSVIRLEVFTVGILEGHLTVAIISVEGIARIAASTGTVGWI